MNDIQKEFLEIVDDVRAHLEYQRALGIKSIEVYPLDVQTPSVQPAAVSVPKEKDRSRSGRSSRYQGDRERQRRQRRSDSP